MPDFVSRNKLKKKVLDRWENEGGNVSTGGKSPESDLPPKRKRKKSRLVKSLDTASAKNAAIETPRRSKSS